MRFPCLAVLYVSMFAVSFVLSGCGSASLMSSGSSGGAPPVVSAVGDQVNGIAANRKQEVQFNEAMNPATINSQSFQVADSSGKLAAGTVSYDPDFNTASFLPNPALQSGATYRATITTAAASADGAHLAKAYSYGFTTRSTSDTSPLMVNSVDPAANATCVSATKAITITFDEAPDASTLTAGNLAVNGPGGAIVVKISTNVSTTQVVLTPASPLPSGTITVTLSSVADLAGVKMAAPYTWSFSTDCGGGGATYLYVGVDSPPAVRGYHVDVNSANLTEIPGSPFVEAGAGPSTVIVNNDFVYTTTTDLTTLGGAPFPSGTTSFRIYRADAFSGTLTLVQDFTIPLNSGIFFEPTGHNAYEIDGSTFTLLTINSDGSLTKTGTSFTLPGPLEWIAASPNGKLIYEGAETGTIPCGKGPCQSHDVIWQIDRDPVSGTLTPNHQVSGTSDLHLNNLRFDPSGNHLLGMSNSLNQITVESVNYSTGDLTQVPGSPFPSTGAQTGEFTRTFEVDSSGKFVYTVSLAGINSVLESVSVFSFSQATGVLTPVQTIDITPGSNPTALVVDQALVYVVNWPNNQQPVGPFIPSSINVFRRDPMTGMLDPGGSPVIMQDQEGLQGAAVMHFQ